MRRPGEPPVALLASLVLGLLLTASGCELAEDDEMVSEPRATRPAATTTAPDAPDRVPVGRAGISPRAPAWAQGSTLHVGAAPLDLAPRRLDAFVSTPGGVYFVDRGELWFTDLERVRGTGLSEVTGLVADAEGRNIEVTVEPGGAEPTTLAYRTDSGERVSPSRVSPAAATDRLGRRARVAVDARGVSLRPGADDQVVTAWVGPGGYGVVAGAAALVAFDAATGERVPLGEAPSDFELAGWTGPATFYGLVSPGDRASSVVGCDLVRRGCRTLGEPTGEGPVVLGTGS